jgi:hypothetical protein
MRKIRMIVAAAIAAGAAAGAFAQDSFDACEFFTEVEAK